MGLQSARLVAGKIRSPPVPECTACLGILAESCKREDWTLSRSAEAASDTSDTRGENTRGEMRSERKDGKGGRDSSRNCISAGVAGSEAKMRKFYCEVSRSRALGHEWVAETSTVTTMKLRHTELRKSSVPGRHFASSSVRRPHRRRYGNSLMCKDGDKIESR